MSFVSFTICCYLSIIALLATSIINYEDDGSLEQNLEQLKKTPFKEFQQMTDSEKNASKQIIKKDRKIQGNEATLKPKTELQDFINNVLERAEQFSRSARMEIGDVMRKIEKSIKGSTTFYYFFRSDIYVQTIDQYATVLEGMLNCSFS